MNQINPIHILAFLIVVLFLLFVKLGQTNNALQTEQNAYDKTSALVTKLKALQNIYDAKAQTKKALERILRQPMLVSADVEQKTRGDLTVLTLKSIDKRALDFLMSKILNAPFNITQLDIERVSDEKANVTLELQW